MMMSNHRREYLKCFVLLICIVSCKSVRQRSQLKKIGQVQPNREGLTIPKEAMATSTVKICYPAWGYEVCSSGIVLKDGYVLGTLHSYNGARDLFPKEGIKIGQGIAPISTDGEIIPATRTNLQTMGYLHPPHFDFEIVAVPSKDEGYWEMWDESCDKTTGADIILYRVVPEQLELFEKWTYAFSTRDFNWGKQPTPSAGQSIPVIVAGFPIENYRKQMQQDAVEWQGKYVPFDIHNPNFNSGFHSLFMESWNDWKCVGNFSRDLIGNDTPKVLMGFSGSPVFDHDGYLLSMVKRIFHSDISPESMEPAPREFRTTGLGTIVVKDALEYFDASSLLDVEVPGQGSYRQDRLDHYFNTHKPTVQEYYPQYLEEFNERLEFFKDNKMTMEFPFGKSGPLYCVTKNVHDPETNLNAYVQVNSTRIKLNDDGSGTIAYRVKQKFNKWDWSEPVAFKAHEFLFQYSIHRERESIVGKQDAEYNKYFSMGALGNFYSHKATKDKKWEIYRCQYYMKHG